MCGNARIVYSCILTRGVKKEDIVVYKIEKKVFKEAVAEALSMHR
jgi:hypothetical protein